MRDAILSLSGKSGCPHGIFSFGLAIQEDGGTQMYGDREIISIFESDPQMLTDFVAYLKTM